eukprot:1977300-Rhodomonas_salina.7
MRGWRPVSVVVDEVEQVSRVDSCSQHTTASHESSSQSRHACMLPCTMRAIRSFDRDTSQEEAVGTVGHEEARSKFDEQDVNPVVVQQPLRAHQHLRTTRIAALACP